MMLDDPGSQGPSGIGDGPKDAEVRGGGGGG